MAQEQRQIRLRNQKNVSLEIRNLKTVSPDQESENWLSPNQETYIQLGILLLFMKNCTATVLCLHYNGTWITQKLFLGGVFTLNMGAYFFLSFLMIM